MIHYKSSGVNKIVAAFVHRTMDDRQRYGLRKNRSSRLVQDSLRNIDWVIRHALPDLLRICGWGIFHPDFLMRRAMRTSTRHGHRQYRGFFQPKQGGKR